MTDSRRYALRDRAAYFPAAGVLVIADVHLGRDRASNVQFPLGERGDVVERLEALLDRFEPRAVVVAGDLLHSFDRLPSNVLETLDAVRESIDAAGAELVVTPGNHDALLESAYDGPRPAEYAFDAGDERVVVSHGHDPPEAPAALYVIGHDHPAITIEGTKRPCFLSGPAAGRDADVLVLPAFNRLVRGVDLARARTLRSPLLGSSGDYRPLVRDEEADETLAFPPLGAFRSLL